MKRNAFTLMEVLVALAIFAIGFVAVAAIFPSAAILQRRAADDIQSRHAKLNAEAIIGQTRLTYDQSDSTTDLYFYHHEGAGASPTYSALRAFDGSAKSLDAFWSLDTRSYAAGTVAPDLRRFYWVPLIRDAEGSDMTPDWRVFVFVLQREPDATYTEGEDGTTGKTFAAGWASQDGNTIPSVKRYELNSASGSTFELTQQVEIAANDWLVSSNGRIYQVDAVRMASSPYEVDVDGIITGTPSHLWFAPPSDDGNSTPDDDDISPTVMVFQMPQSDLNYN